MLNIGVQLFKELKVVVWMCKFCFISVLFKAHQVAKLISVRDKKLPHSIILYGFQCV